MKLDLHEPTVRNPIKFMLKDKAFPETNAAKAFKRQASESPPNTVLYVASCMLLVG